MDRRSFIKTVVGSALAALVPVKSIASALCSLPKLSEAPTPKLRALDDFSRSDGSLSPEKFYIIDKKNWVTFDDDTAREILGFEPNTLELRVP